MLSNTTSSADVLIRKAIREDCDTIYRFICELEEQTLDRDQFERLFEHNLSNSMIHYLIAEVASKQVGFVSCHVQYLLHHGGKVGEIQELFVRADYRNQRIGHQLLSALNEIATREKFVNLEVTTNQKRTDTVRFYERESFHRTHLKLVKPIEH